MIPTLCVCGETHKLPESGRVWFLHPDNHEFAQMVMAAEAPDMTKYDKMENARPAGPMPAIRCHVVPRQQAINLDAAVARRLIGTVNPAEIVEG